MFFLSSKLNFDLCRRAEIIRVGLKMHLYDDIGDASSSLRGSTSSYCSSYCKRCIIVHIFTMQILNVVCVSSHSFVVILIGQ